MAELLLPNHLRLDCETKGIAIAELLRMAGIDPDQMYTVEFLTDRKMWRYRQGVVDVPPAHEPPRPVLHSIMGHHQGQGGLHFPEPAVRQIVLTADEIVAAGFSLEAFATLLQMHGFDPERPIRWHWEPGGPRLTMFQLQEGEQADG